MPIGDGNCRFFHCKNIADCVIESPRFRYLLSQAQLVRSDFKPPSQKKLVVSLIFFSNCN